MGSRPASQQPQLWKNCDGWDASETEPLSTASRLFARKEFRV
jgi:hypothetical protein